MTRWRDGHMRKRWCAAGLLRAGSDLRRIRGRSAMRTLPRALGSLVREQQAGSKQQVASECQLEPPPISITVATISARLEQKLWN